MARSPKLSCEKCQIALRPGIPVVGDWTEAVCPACGEAHYLRLYPAYVREPAALSTAEAIQGEGESNCFYHEQYRAKCVCESCGRFICGYCEVEDGGRHICLHCLSKGAKLDTVRQGTYTAWDRVILMLAVASIPLVVIHVSVFLCPAVLFLVIYHWKKIKAYPVPGSRISLIVAALIACVPLVGYLIALVSLFYVFSQTSTF